MKTRHHRLNAGPRRPFTADRHRHPASDLRLQVTPAQLPLLPLGAMLRGIALMPASAIADTQDKEARETTLQTINVKDARDAQDNGYQGGTTRVGKIKQLPKDIPQAITIVPEALILDTNSDTLKSALRNVAGLTYNAGEGGRIGDNFNLRRLEHRRPLPRRHPRVAQYNPETFYVDQINVPRGSAATCSSRGQRPARSTRCSSRR